MIVNKVVLLISAARAGEEELISRISRCCLCSATLGPLGGSQPSGCLWTTRRLIRGPSPGCLIRCVTSPPLFVSLLSHSPEAEALSLG